jgi:hypothetical protein
MGWPQTRFGSGVLVSAGFVDGLLSGSDLPLELSSGRWEMPRPPPFAGGRSRRAVFSNESRAGGSSGGRRFRALAFSTCSFGAQRTQRHCRIHRGNLSIEAERLRLSSEQTGVKDALKCAVSPTKLSRTFWPNPGSGSTPMIGLRPRSLEKSPSGAANPERSRARAGPPSLMRQFQSRLRGSQRLQQSLNFTSYGMTRKGGALRGSLPTVAYHRRGSGGRRAALAAGRDA